ncbi:DinB family protein [Mycobacterium sp. 236(2023)]|uniref:DinB family protein n=1 Tax=Mycobacterium sp. 236(2023) TaxID=3038163 RepID=UPI0024155C2F|nr:DinB family protein [Mycobacterium sp. 236(2023)]MDG4666709.1 DinB family protein [Mycobacterium sp. 236(2023)]
MTASQRATPPMNSDEHTTLEAWLDFQRHTLLLRCEGLDDKPLRRASVPPSPLTLQGLVQHMAEVERNWFRRVLAGETAPPIFDPSADTEGHDGGFDVSDSVPFAEAVAIWQREVDAARANCARYELAHASPFMGTEVSLRWIYLHMVGEYARHNGHADLIRERIDGAAGI